MKIKDVQKIMDRNAANMAFFIGNGINRSYNTEGNISWSELLIDLWGKHSFETRSSIPRGITFTEFYDALEIENADKHNFSSLLQKEVKVLMKGWKPNLGQNLILNKIKGFNAPILTTNFDDLIPKSLGLKSFKMGNFGFTDFYPWSSYYAKEELPGPAASGFGVWFPNGMIKYQRSIKLGMSQYMGNVERARELIHANPSIIGFGKETGEPWEGDSTWLHLLFNKSLFIFGFGMDQTEIFVRWLLIERAKYFRRFPEKKHKGWYVGRKGEDMDNGEGKKFFLESVGIEYLELDEYRNIYSDIWE